jgi:hypothetical protein
VGEYESYSPRPTGMIRLSRFQTKDDFAVHGLNGARERSSGESVWCCRQCVSRDCEEVRARPLARSRDFPVNEGCSVIRKVFKKCRGLTDLQSRVEGYENTVVSSDR